MKHVLPICALGALAACSTNAPLESAWYLQTSGASGAEIQIAILNRSDRRLTVNEVLLNRNREDARDTLKRDRPFTVRPGQLVLLPLSDFEPAGKLAECVIPVSLAVRVSEDTRTWLQQTYGRLAGDEEGYLRVDLLGRMPTSLPEKWSCPAG
jgi:hypothetical protein